MVLPHFSYASPDSVALAVALLDTYPKAKIVAGGQKVVPDLRQRRVAPAVLVDLRRIRALRGIHRTDAHGPLSVGAVTTLAEVAGDHDVQARYPALAEAARSTGDPQLRNRGTVGGSLATLAPGSDLPAAALVLDATVTVAGQGGAREVPADALYLHDHESALRHGDILINVILPPVPAGTGSAYERFTNPANLSAVCGVAARITATAGGIITTCRVAATGHAARPMRLRALEAALEGATLTAESIRAAVARGTDGLDCLTDLAASAEYRAYLTGVLAERALIRAAEGSGHHTVKVKASPAAAGQPRQESTRGVVT